LVYLAIPPPPSPPFLPLFSDIMFSDIMNVPVRTNQPERARPSACVLLTADAQMGDGGVTYRRMCSRCACCVLPLPTAPSSFV
jgi:hypothetical protein